jgi:hypothetical protein
MLINTIEFFKSVIPAKAGIQTIRKAIDSDFYPPLAD